MSVRNQLKLLLGGLNARRADEFASGHRTPASSGNNAAHSATRDFLDRNGLVSAAIFVLTVVAIVLISWAGMTTSNFAVLPDQLATVRVTANAAFVYESAEKTRAERAQVHALQFERKIKDDQHDQRKDDHRAQVLFGAKLGGEVFVHDGEHLPEKRHGFASSTRA